MRSAPNSQDKIKIADVVVSTKRVTFLINRLSGTGHFKIQEFKSYKYKFKSERNSATGVRTYDVAVQRASHPCIR